MGDLKNVNATICIENSDDGLEVKIDGSVANIMLALVMTMKSTPRLKKILVDSVEVFEANEELIGELVDGATRKEKS